MQDDFVSATGGLRQPEESPPEGYDAIRAALAKPARIKREMLIVVD